MSDTTNINYWVSFDDEIQAVAAEESVELIIAKQEPFNPEVAVHAREGGIWDVGGAYNDGGMSDAEEIADALHEAFPEALEVRCWSEPAYEWLGTLLVYKRGIDGCLTASCDADGGAVYRWHDINEILDAMRATVKRRFEESPLEADNLWTMTEIDHAFSGLDL